MGRKRSERRTPLNSSKDTREARRYPNGKGKKGLTARKKKGLIGKSKFACSSEIASIKRVRNLKVGEIQKRAET